MYLFFSVLFLNYTVPVQDKIFAMLEADHTELIYLPEAGLCVLKFNKKILPESTDLLHRVQL